MKSEDNSSSHRARMAARLCKRIAAIHIVILVDIYRTFREVKNSGEYNDYTFA